MNGKFWNMKSFVVAKIVAAGAAVFWNSLYHHRFLSWACAQDNLTFYHTARKQICRQLYKKVLRVRLFRWRLLGKLSASDVHSQMQLGKKSLVSSSIVAWALISAKASTKPIHQCLAASLCQLPLLQSTKVAGPCFLSGRCAFFDDAHLILFPWLGIQASKSLRRIYVRNQSRRFISSVDLRSCALQKSRCEHATAGLVTVCKIGKSRFLLQDVPEFSHRAGPSDTSLWWTGVFLWVAIQLARAAKTTTWRKATQTWGMCLPCVWFFGIGGSACWLGMFGCLASKWNADVGAGFIAGRLRRDVALNFGQDFPLHIRTAPNEFQDCMPSFTYCHKVLRPSAFDNSVWKAKIGSWTILMGHGTSFLWVHAATFSTFAEFVLRLPDANETSSAWSYLQSRNCLCHHGFGVCAQDNLTFHHARKHANHRKVLRVRLFQWNILGKLLASDLHPECNWLQRVCHQQELNCQGWRERYINRLNQL